jgi:hypothetical protein
MGRPDFSRGTSPMSLQGRTIGAWRVFGHCGPQTHHAIRTDAGNGGSTAQKVGHVELHQDGTNGAYAMLDIPSRAFGIQSGVVICYYSWRTNQAIGQLAETVEIGLMGDGNADEPDIAVFRPDAGQGTEGNVRVDSGGNDHDGQVSYPLDITKAHFYAILVDFDDDLTEFYVNADPFTADPNAQITATPNKLRSFGGQIVSGGIDGGETLKMHHVGYIYIP